MGEYARLTNGEVWYEATGDGAPLLLIHGGAVDGRFFAQNVGPLAEAFRVITMDLWGHGRTADRDGPFSLDSFATDAAELIGQVAEEMKGDRRDALQSAYEEVEEQEDEHLFHTKGWARELWLQALGMPAVLPPPEEQKKVVTAIGAARAEQARKEMLN